MSSKTNPSKGIQKKERGWVLSLLLVIMALHGAAAAYLYYTVRVEDALLDRPWILTLMVIHFLANVVAAFGIWYWQKWAIYLYVASTILALVVGLLAVGIWSVFYMVLPLAILGWVLRTKWSYFD